MEGQTKKFYLSSSDKIIAGVCGGLGKYFEIDSTIIRIIFIALVFFHGLGILIYLILMLIAPHESAVKLEGEIQKQETPNEPHTGEKNSETKKGKASIDFKSFLGFILVAIGVFIFLERIFPGFYFRWDLFWPVVLILFGLLIILR